MLSFVTVFNTSEHGTHECVRHEAGLKFDSDAELDLARRFVKRAQGREARLETLPAKGGDSKRG